MFGKDVVNWEVVWEVREKLNNGEFWDRMKVVRYERGVLWGVEM